MSKFGILFSILFFFSCENEQQGFKGSQDNSQESDSSVATPAPEPVQDVCVDSGSTNAFLLTRNVLNGSREQFVRYRLEVNDCPGNLKEVAGTIKFDVKATLVPFDAPLPYTVIDPGSDTEISSGQLKLVRGEDLFGTVDENVGFYQTEKFSVQTGVDSIVLNIDVSGMYFTPDDLDTGGLATTEVAGEFSIPTFLSISSAEPVKTEVTFKTLAKKP